MTKTRDNLAVIDELLLYWNLFDTDRVVDEIEEGGLLPTGMTFGSEWL
ncbi:hypothetical protein HanOQP8_Chr13g0506121 [Helianthus annuus]|nr:hypothetical protein HanOQP8_Chr13g0506121 [Helianthus annuus]